MRGHRAIDRPSGSGSTPGDEGGIRRRERRRAAFLPLFLLVSASALPATEAFAEIGASFSSARAMPQASGSVAAILTPESVDLARRSRRLMLTDSVWQPQKHPGWAQMAGDDASSGTVGNRHLRSIGLSILLPGLAQYRMGHKLRATAYFTAEAAFWTAFTGYRIQGSTRAGSYRQMAELFAGVQDAGSRDDEYYKTIGSWPSSDLYNEIVIGRDARLEHGDDLEARAAYYEEHKIQEAERWVWDSGGARSRYRDKRNDAQRSFKNSRNMIGLAVANRVVAMIDAVLLERKHSTLRVELIPDPANQGARFAISRALP